MIVYFYYYCGIGLLALIVAHYLKTSKQREKEEEVMHEAVAEAEKTLPIPALAAAYVLTAATTILIWPYYFFRSLLEGE